MQEHATGDSPGPVVDEDPPFERRAWRAQRVGRVAVALFVLAALAGVFGGGGLSHGEITDESGTLRVEFARFLRSDAPFDLTVTLTDPPRQPSGHVALWLDDSLPGVFQIESMSPEPTAQLARDGRLVLDFAVAGRSPAPIRFRLEAKELGWRTGRIGVVGGGTVELGQLIYP